MGLIDRDCGDSLNLPVNALVGAPQPSWEASVPGSDQAHAAAAQPSWEVTVPVVGEAADATANENSAPPVWIAPQAIRPPIPFVPTLNLTGINISGGTQQFDISAQDSAMGSSHSSLRGRESVTQEEQPRQKKRAISPQVLLTDASAIPVDSGGQMLQDVRLQHELARAMRRSEAEQASIVVPQSPHALEVKRLTEWYFDKTKAEYWGRETQWESEWAGYTQAQQDVVNVEVAEARASAEALAHSHIFQAAESAAQLKAQMQAQAAHSRAEAVQLMQQNAADIGQVQHLAGTAIASVNSEAASKIQQLEQALLTSERASYAGQEHAEHYKGLLNKTEAENRSLHKMANKQPIFG